MGNGVQARGVCMRLCVHEGVTVMSLKRFLVVQSLHCQSPLYIVPSASSCCLESSTQRRNTVPLYHDQSSTWGEWQFSKHSAEAAGRHARPAACSGEQLVPWYDWACQARGVASCECLIRYPDNKWVARMNYIDEGKGSSTIRVRTRNRQAEQ